MEKITLRSFTFVPFTNTVGVIKSTRVSWVDHVEDKECIQNFSGKSQREETTQES
jgi:hypothetical protein